MKLKPLNDNLVLLPSDSNMRGILYVPDTYKDAATACAVIAAGPKVNPLFRTPGQIVLCQTGFAGRLHDKVSGTDAFWCKEANIYAVMKNNIIFPFGRKVLIRRDVEESQAGRFVVPKTLRTQSLTGKILRLGLHRTFFKVQGLEVGMQVRLSEWQDTMVQIELEDGSQGLIVNESDLLYYEIETP